MKYLSLILTVIPVLAFADAGDLSGQIQQATEEIKQWGTDAMLLVVVATVGFAVITKWWCPRWLERARQNSLESIGAAVFLYVVFYFFGDTIRAAFKSALDFWGYFDL